MRITSRKIPRDPYGSGETKQMRHEVRVDGKVLGYFNQDTGKFRLSWYKTEEERLAVPSEPCTWKWIVLKKPFANKEEVIAWVKSQWEILKDHVHLNEM